MKVNQAMHTGVEWMAPTTTIVELAKAMKKHDIGSIPIGENDKLIGMVTDRDIVCRGLANGADVKAMTARDVMTKGVTFCRDDQDLGDALRLMEEKRIRRLPVLNKDKRMIGILSLGDISGSGHRELAGEVLQSVSAHHN